MLVGILGIACVAWLLWFVPKMNAEPTKLADWKRIAPDGVITKGVIWRNPEGIEISGGPEDESGLVIKRHVGEGCGYTYTKGGNVVFHLFFDSPGNPFHANFMDQASGELIWSATFVGSSAFASVTDKLIDGVPDRARERVVRIDIEENRPRRGATTVSTKTSYFPDTNEMVVQELHNGTPWNGVFYTPTIPHWRVDAYKNGVATELGKNLDDADIAQMEKRYRQYADKDYNADVTKTVQLYVQEIQFALGTNMPFTADCSVD